MIKTLFKIIIKMIIGFSIILTGVLPILFFAPLTYNTKIEWLLMVKKLPDNVIYVIGGMIIISCLLMFIIGFRYVLKSIIIDINNRKKRDEFVEGIRIILKEE